MSKVEVHIKGVIGVDSTLQSVIADYKKIDSPTEAKFIIESNGGYVQSGKDIHNFIQSLDIPTHTHAVKAYSIAATIFLAGDTRTTEDVSKPVMFHLPLAQNVTGTSATFANVSEQLKVHETYFIDFYAEALGITKEISETLLKNETFLSPSECFDMGITTEPLESVEAVAFFNEDKKGFMNKTSELIRLMAIKFGITKDEVAPVAIEVTDADGNIIDFHDLDDGAEAGVGDMAKIDGVPAEGSVVMPSGETYQFEDGELKVIVPKADDEPADTTDDDTTDDVDAVAIKPKAETISEIYTWETDVVNTSFELDEQVMYAPLDGESEPTSVGAGEWQLDDGRKILTDSEGYIRFIKPATGDAPSDDEPADTTDDEPTEAEAVALALIKENEKLKKEVVDAKAALISPNLDDEPVKITAEMIAAMTPLQRRRHQNKNM